MYFLFLIFLSSVPYICLVYFCVLYAFINTFSYLLREKKNLTAIVESY